MDKQELIRLIQIKSNKLKYIRQQCANGNDNQMILFNQSLLSMLQKTQSHPFAYDQINNLLILGSDRIVYSLNKQVLPRVANNHNNTKLDQYLIFWGNIFDGNAQKSKYPNLKSLFSHANIKNKNIINKQLFQNYQEQFVKNFNIRNNLRVQFFQDFQDSLEDDTSMNQSHLISVFHLHLVELKAARQKLQEQNLNQQTKNQQIIKLKHFLTLTQVQGMTQYQRQQFTLQKNWVKAYLSCQQIAKSKNIQLQEDSFDLRDQGSKQLQPKIFQTKNNIQAKGLVTSSRKKIFDQYVNNSSFRSKNNLSLQIKDYDLVKQTPYKQIENKFKSNNIYNDCLSDKSNLTPSNIIIRKVNYQQYQQRPDQSYTQPYFYQNKNKPVDSVKSPQAFKTQNFDKKQYMSPKSGSKYKLSDLTSQKKARKQQAPVSKLSYPETYILKPFVSHFGGVSSEFNEFRRNCFQTNITIFVNAVLSVSCLLDRSPNSKLRVQIIYINNYNTPLYIQSIYKVPKCYNYQKINKISKNFELHNTVRHIFVLQTKQFPLQPCSISLKSKTIDQQFGFQTFLLLPLTMLNFIQYLCVTQQQWFKQWQIIKKKQTRKHYTIEKHFYTQKNVVMDEIDWMLRDQFIPLGGIQGYSIQDYGSYCFYSLLDNLSFLVKLSVRFNNIVILSEFVDGIIGQNIYMIVYNDNMNIKINRILGKTIVILAYPALYYCWTQQIKKTWIENDIIKEGHSILYPEDGRFAKKDPTIEYNQSFSYFIKSD